jgi:hypothetical protein
MGQIYSGAIEVRAWLGVCTSNNILGMQRLQETDWIEPVKHQFCQPFKEPSGSEAERERRWRLLAALTTNDYRIPIRELTEPNYWSLV